jgi:hypothetical protein
MSEPQEKLRVLTDRQREIAAGIIAVLADTHITDAFPAMVSVISATINHNSPDRAAAHAIQDLVCEMLAELIELGWDGKLEMSK